MIPARSANMGIMKKISDSSAIPSKSHCLVTAMVIDAKPVGEYDKRVVLLTREKGKIAAFAKRAKRPSSPLAAATDVFSFGTYDLYMGRSSYTIQEASVQNYFPYFRTHVEASLLGQYFCEVMEYCTKENNDEEKLLLLLYQSLRAMEAEKIPLLLIEAVFELKTVDLEGELKELDLSDSSPAVQKAFKRIQESEPSKLYSFTLSLPAQEELLRISHRELDYAMDYHRFHSREILEQMQL